MKTGQSASETGLPFRGAVRVAPRLAAASSGGRALL